MASSVIALRHGKRLQCSQFAAIKKVTETCWFFVIRQKHDCLAVVWETGSLNLDAVCH